MGHELTHDWAASGEGFVEVWAGVKGLAGDAASEGVADIAATARAEKMSLLNCIARVLDYGSVVMIQPKDGEEIRDDGEALLYCEWSRLLCTCKAK